MSTLMMPVPAATMTTMTNTSPIAVTQPKAPSSVPNNLGVVSPDPTAVKMGFINNNKQGKKKEKLL